MCCMRVAYTLASSHVPRPHPGLVSCPGVWDETNPGYETVASLNAMKKLGVAWGRG